MFEGIEIYRWLTPLIALFYIIRTIRQYAKGKTSPRNTIIWTVFWISVALLAIMPNVITDNLARALGIRDQPNAIIFLAIGILFLMIFYLSAALNRVENTLTELIRQLALNELPHTPQKSQEAEKTVEKSKNANIE